MRALAIGLVLLAAPLPTLAGEAPRFSGSGGLVAGDVISANRRYAMQADLKRGDPTQRGGRFSLDARLAASDAAKAASAACGAGPEIFRNGFE
ncbi:MAG: hypothetical protein JNL89_01835 [Rhodanobacteraceae bacterium]|nr:hypothetical protein [Rhodanobacteraceae bacterium]